MNKELIEKTNSTKTTAIFSKDNKKRYLLKYEWDDSKPKACIIMKKPSTSDEYITDQTTLLVRNNAARNNFGSISIVNLFCGLDKTRFETDRINSSILADECSKSDIIIVAFGRGIGFEEQKQSLLEGLAAYKEKLFTIEDSKGQPFSHPLSPQAREWQLVRLEKLTID